MNLHELRVFARVAELGSFSRAADQLGLAKGRVSAAVQHLEVQVGARLLHRTTRQVRLTEEGEAFLERCRELLADAEQLQAMFQPAAAGLRGRIRNQRAQPFSESRTFLHTYPLSHPDHRQAAACRPRTSRASAVYAAAPRDRAS